MKTITIALDCEDEEQLDELRELAEKLVKLLEHTPFTARVLWEE